MKRPILGLVLSGGKGRRLGQDKALYEFREGERQLDWTLRLLDAYCDRLAVSCRADQLELRENWAQAQLLVDEPRIEGPLAGIIAGLRYARGSPVLVLACDMPLLDASVLLRLVTRRDETKLATCFNADDGKPEPLCAIYESDCLALLEGRAAKGQRSMRRFLEDSDVERIALSEPQMLASANTKEDVEAIRHRMNSHE